MSSQRSNAQTNPLHRPEFRLLLACLRWQEVIPSELLSSDLDWDLVLEASERHSILPLVHRALAQSPGVPAKTRENLESGFRLGVCRNLFLTAELIRLLDGFSKHGISVLPYKGPMLAQALYGDIGLRAFTDLDLLVRPGDVRRATAVLETLGYAADLPISAARHSAHLALAAEQMFRRTTGAALVELQWRIAPTYFSVDFDLNWFWRTAVPVPLGSRQVSALSPEVLLLVLSVHGAKHHWQSLVWVADMARLVDSYPGLDWDSVLQRARLLGMERLLFLALGLAESLLDARLPELVRQQLAADRAVPWLVRRVERNLASEVREVPHVSDHWFSLRSRERWLDRCRYVARLGLTPNQQDWALLPLPSALGPLYFGVRPIRLLGRTVRFAWQSLFGALAAHGLRTLPRPDRFEPPHRQ